MSVYVRSNPETHIVLARARIACPDDACTLVRVQLCKLTLEERASDNYATNRLKNERRSSRHDRAVTKLSAPSSFTQNSLSIDRREFNVHKNQFGTSHDMLVSVAICQQHGVTVFILETHGNTNITTNSEVREVKCTRHQMEVCTSQNLEITRRHTSTIIMIFILFYVFPSLTKPFLFHKFFRLLPILPHIISSYFIDGFDVISQFLFCSSFPEALPILFSWDTIKRM